MLRIGNKEKKESKLFNPDWEHTSSQLTPSEVGKSGTSAAHSDLSWFMPQVALRPFPNLVPTLKKNKRRMMN